ncbi:outer membrane protein assembly factor BamD [Flavobacteriaceae bacterium]|jgi:outer membrane protein assembly factor BamD|nr:outer membrane protein assembly factor BamD [Flavobacteriaceae bacterium]
MILKTFKSLVVLLLLISLASCSDYQKLLNNPDINLKYKGAEAYYNAGEYKKANRVLEQIVPSYRGKPQAQRIIFFYANSFFQIRDYNLAAYQFESFVKAYPKSDRLQEAYFMAAKSYYMLSPRSSLDQQDTYTAIDKLQVFLDNYPSSEFSEEANTLIAELQVKLEKKFFEISKKYHTIRDYKAALNAFDNFISDFPGTQYKEEALYYKFLSSYELAINSIFAKKEDRLTDAEELGRTLLSYFPESLFLDDIDKKLKTIKKELNTFDQSTTTNTK